MINMFFIRKLFTYLVYCIFLTLAGINAYGAKADTLLNGLTLETKVHYGFIYPHHKAIEYLLGGNIKGFEINLSTHSFGRHPWEELYRYPRYGVGYNFTDFANPKILGYAHGFFGYIDIPFYRPKGNFSFNYQVDGGVSYITEKYEIYNNPLDLAISSSVDVYIGLDFIARLKIDKKHEIKTALELTHYSNGKWRSPNLGLNTVTISAAWLYSLKPSQVPRSQPFFDGYKRNFTEILLNTGFKRDDLLNEKLYMISSAIIDYYRGFSPKYAYGGGVDFFYDPSLAPTREYEEDTIGSNSDNFQIGTHLGFRIRYNRLSIILNAGYYCHANFYKYSRIYSRLGMRYTLTDNILINFTLKAHYAIADYIEWGIGYRFNSKGK